MHRLLEKAYASGGGRVPPFDIWWPQLRDDAEYDPALVILATDDAGAIVGVAQCWTSAFLKDLAVADAWRRRGVGAALMRRVFEVFQARGAPHVELKVEVGNPSGAERLYRSLGMTPVEAG